MPMPKVSPRSLCTNLLRVSEKSTECLCPNHFPRLSLCWFIENKSSPRSRHPINHYHFILFLNFPNAHQNPSSDFVLHQISNKANQYQIFPFYSPNSKPIIFSSINFSKNKFSTIFHYSFLSFSLYFSSAFFLCLVYI